MLEIEAVRRGLSGLLLCGVAGAALAQSPSMAAPSPSYGTSGTSELTISAYGFAPAQSDATYAESNGSRWMTTGTGTWAAPVTLPAGASLLAIEVQGCDDAPGGYLEALLYRSTITSGTESTTLLADNIAGEPDNLPGCGSFPKNLIQPETIDNAHNSYSVTFSHQGVLDGTTRFQAVRLRYKLQVSPPPAVATFADVPVGSAQFPFVEALVAAGITAGCGGGNFCPNAPITRGQMAVFLSAALGLYWPN